MKFLTITTALLVANITFAQESPVVRAHITPDSIGIGDRFELSIEVEKDQVQVVAFPDFSDAAKSGFEVIEVFPVDTLERKGRFQRLRRRYQMAAFEEGNFNLGHVNVLYMGKNIVDTLRSEDSLLLRVGTFEIDSTSHSIFDLKPQKTLSFRIAEIFWYIVWGFLVLIALLLIAFFVHRYFRRSGRSLDGIFRSEPPLPPHVAAIKALEELHHQKLWQNNRYKQYYSGITDILRTYIDARYGVGAMEMTSDEILATMRSVDALPKKSAMDLADILRTADLVKFAKVTPDAEQNEDDYLKAYYFVEETKPEPEVPDGEDNAPDVSSEN